MCIAEFSTHDNQLLNASSETTLMVQQQQQNGNQNNMNLKKHYSNARQRPKTNHNDLSDYLLNDRDDEDESSDLTDEFPALNPTIVENYDDKGFCEPYRGSVCSGIITGNYSVYSTSSQQQDLIEERLKTIIPLLLSNKNNLSKRCSTFAIPSLCLFAFPLCDRQTKQPKQICRFDCKQLQQDICKNEYFNVKTLLETKLDLNTQTSGSNSASASSSGSNSALSQQQNFLLDCNQLPPSSDSPNDCVPIVTMTLDKLESKIIEFNQKQQEQQLSSHNVPTQNCILSNGVEYRGTQSITRNGYTCQKWSEQYPHVHTYKSIPELAGHNYCRNVDNDVEPWCFTTNPNQRKDYCYIPKCVGVPNTDPNSPHNTGYINQTPVEATSSVLSEKKLINLLYILVPSVCIPFLLLCILLTFCYCRKVSSATSPGVNGKPINNNMSANTNDSNVKSNCNGSAVSGSVNGSNPGGPLHPSRLRMSNASLGQHKNTKHLKNGASHRVCSSKSSVASGSTTTNTNNGEMNPFLKQQQIQQQQHQQQNLNNYDNYYNQFGNVVNTANNMVHQQHMMALQSAQCLMPPPPPPLPMSIMPLGMGGMSQHPPMPTCNEYVPLRQVNTNDIHLTQEIGKGRFGPVYIGDLMESNSNSSATRVTIKTFDRKLFTKSKANKNAYQQETTSTPNVHNLNKMNNANTNEAGDLNLPSAEEHFMEQEFYNEISLYSNLRHKYLANLIALNTKQPNNRRVNKNLDSDLEDEHSENDDEDFDTDMPKCMIFEHLNLGDLHEFLVQRAASLQTQIMQHQHQMNNIYGSQSNLSAVSSSIGGASTTNYLNMQQQQRNVADFLYIGLQIASGMEYLASQNFILKDLATRNILMNDTLTVKISIDLVAQYKETYNKDYYKFQMKLLPVRWMSPECLLYGRYAQQSDVWSYGVCLWEIFSYGQQPYAGCTSPEAIEMIRDRQLLGIPEECPQRAYALMLECWNDVPTQRPTFTDIINKLRNWENYYLFNGYQPHQQMLQQAPQLIMPPPPPPPLLPMNVGGSSCTQMTSSYSSNSQASKTSSSLMGNTLSTGVSSVASSIGLSGPQPLITQYQNGAITTTTLGNTNNGGANGYYFSPSKANLFGNQKISPPSSTITSSNMGNGGGQFNRYFRDTLDPMSSLRMSQRQHPNNHGTFASNIFTNIPTSTTTTTTATANIDHHF
jgi:hypothetical protein